MNVGSASTEESPIVVEDLTVRYGRVTALAGVSLTVARGTVYALLGRNGAGKSSLIRCLLGQQKPSRGRVSLHGLEPWTQRRRAMERTGVVPEDPDAPPGMTVERIVAFCAHVYPSWNDAAVNERLRRYEIPPAVPLGRLSKGQKGLVALALALGHAPAVLVLDDPTLGLDVAARRALFEEVVVDLADRGTTVFLTTHDLTGVEGIADRVGILKAGSLIVDEAMETLKERHATTSPALEEIFLTLTAAGGGGGAP
jgi:ABC-2 type transport system ATP-binding protein